MVQLTCKYNDPAHNIAATAAVGVEADIASNMILSAHRPHLNSTEKYI